MSSIANEEKVLNELLEVNKTLLEVSDFNRMTLQAEKMDTKEFINAVRQCGGQINITSTLVTHENLAEFQNKILGTNRKLINEIHSLNEITSQLKTRVDAIEMASLKHEELIKSAIFEISLMRLTLNERNTSKTEMG